MRIGFHALSHLRLLPPRCHSIWKCWRKEEKRNTHTTEIRKEKERRKNLMTLNGAGLWIFLIPCTAILYSFVSRHGITHTHTIECAYSVWCVCEAVSIGVIYGRVTSLPSYTILFFNAVFIRDEERSRTWIRRGYVLPQFTADSWPFL